LKTLLVLWIETSVISPDGTRWYGIASQNNELGLIDTRNKTLERQQQQQQQPKAATLQPSRLGKLGNKEVEKKGHELRLGWFFQD
jgi:hypothetical protein